MSNQIFSMVPGIEKRAGGLPPVTMSDVYTLPGIGRVPIQFPTNTPPIVGGKKWQLFDITKPTKSSTVTLNPELKRALIVITSIILIVIAIGQINDKKLL